jgi:hypothetical protein
MVSTATVNSTEDAPKSILEEWLQKFFEDWINFGDYWQERKRILQTPEVMLERGAGGIRRSPLHFATQPIITLLILVALLTGILNAVPAWRPPYSPEREIQKHDQRIAVLQYQKERAIIPVRQAEIQSQIAEENRRKQTAKVRRWQHESLLEMLKLLTGPYLLLIGVFLRRRLQRFPQSPPEAALADRLFLYDYGARSFRMTCAYIAYILAAGLARGYGWLRRENLEALGQSLLSLLPMGNLSAFTLSLWILVLILGMPLVLFCIEYYRVERVTSAVIAEQLGWRDGKATVRKALQVAGVWAGGLFLMAATVLHAIFYATMVALTD